MKLFRKGMMSALSYCVVICLCMLGLITIIGTGGGGGDDGGGNNSSEVVGSYSANGPYQFIPSASETEIYEEIYFSILDSNFPADWGFQVNDQLYYENRYYPDDAGTDELWLIGEDEDDYFVFYRVGERTGNELQTVGTWQGTDDYGDIYTLTLGDPSYTYWDEWDIYYYMGPYTFTVSYTDEGEEEGIDILPPPAHDPR